MAETRYAIRHALTRLGEYASHPLAYGVVLAYALLWLFFDRATLDLEWRCDVGGLVHDFAHPAHRAPRYAGAAGEAR